jgi:hypothetical protein
MLVSFTTGIVVQQAQAGIELESGAHADATAADVEPPSPPSPPPNPPSSRSASAPVRGNDGRSKALKARVEASQVEHAPVPGIKPMSLIKMASPSTQGTIVFQRQSHRTCDQPALFEFGTGFLPPETDAQRRRWRRYFQAETRDWRPRRARNGRKNGLFTSELSVAGFGRLGGGGCSREEPVSENPIPMLTDSNFWLFEPGTPATRNPGANGFLKEST